MRPCSAAIPRSSASGAALPLPTAFFLLLLTLGAALLLLGSALAGPAAATGQDEALARSGEAARTTASGAAPRISRLQTTTPRVARTQAVTVIGSGFGEGRGNSAVTFGGRRATAYIRWSDDRIVCRVPTSATLGKVRVRVLTDLGLSNAKRLRIRTARPLGRPTALAPRSTIEKNWPLFRWSGDERATSYEVRVSIDGVVIYSRSRLRKRSWRPPVRLLCGPTLTWKVRARRAGRVGPWSRSVSFRVQGPIGIQRPPDAVGYDEISPTYAELVLFAGWYVPSGFVPADGRVWQLHDNLFLRPLGTLLRDAYGGDGDQTIGLPPALDWPSGARPEHLSGQGRWLVATDGWWPAGIHPDAYPGQVMFSASAGLPWSGSFRRELAAQGAVANPVGAEVFADCAAYDVPEDRQPPEGREYLIGELRLFKETATLPDGLVPADGRLFRQMEQPSLFSIIGYAYGWGSTSYQFRIPTVTAPEGYVWAIAVNGEYPWRP